MASDLFTKGSIHNMMASTAICMSQDRTSCIAPSSSSVPTHAMATRCSVTEGGHKKKTKRRQTSKYLQMKVLRYVADKVTRCDEGNRDETAPRIDETPRHTQHIRTDLDERDQQEPRPRLGVVYEHRLEANAEPVPLPPDRSVVRLRSLPLPLISPRK